MIPHSSSAFIFPAFINEYPEDPFCGLRDLQNHFRELLINASSLVDPELADFDFVLNHYLQDELKTQYLTFIYSCAAADILRGKKILPIFSAGYSMGIYAALVNAGTIAFNDGLFLIRKAAETIRNTIRDQRFGMCSVIGLSRNDIGSLIDAGNLHVRITNQNSRYAFVLSGLYEDILNLIEAATGEGALHTHLLTVSMPYHSEYLKETSLDFDDFLDTLQFSPPRIKIMSLIDQRILHDVADIKKEIIQNIFKPLNWYKTQSELMIAGVNLFIECGPGRNLVKNSKFIEGEYQFLSLSGFLKLKT